jgi:hypothetical protein
MATAKKPIVSRIPKSFDTKHLGEEPAFSEGSGEITVIEMMKAFNWYNYFNDYKSSAKILIDNYPHFDKTEKQIKSDIAVLKKVNPFDIPPTIAYMARMMFRGCEFNDQQMATFEYRIHSILDNARSKEKKETNNITKVVSIQDRTHEKANEMLGDIEGEIDDFIHNEYKSKFSTYEWLQGNSVKTVYCSHIKEIYQGMLDELLIAKNKEDEQVVEGYSFMTAAQLNRFIKFIQSIIDDADTWANNNKKVKTSRKKKTVKTIKVDKLFSKFQYLKTFNELKLVSISPEKILGAGQLIVYNTKYKTLSHFYAASSEGFSVKGTTVQNVSEKSITKRLRNPKNVLTELQKCGIIAMRKMINGINTKESIANHRINNNTILLKVFK